MAKKSTKAEKTKTEPKLNYCTMQTSKKCKEKEGYLSEEDFYSTADKTIYANGRYNICKNCMDEYIGQDENIDLDRFRKILRIFDIPFIEKDFQTAINSKQRTIGVYMRCIQLNRSDKTWMDSDSGLFNMDDFVPPDESEFKVTREIVRKWGRNKTEEDYQLLEEMYEEWCEDMPHEHIVDRKGLINIVLKEFDIMKAKEADSNANTKDLEDSLRKFMVNAKAVAKENKEDNAGLEEDAWGTFIDVIENVKCTPAEYFKDKKLYFDFDGIVDYLNRFVFRPLKNILAKTKEFDKEFSVESMTGFMEKEAKEAKEVDYGNRLDETNSKAAMKEKVDNFKAQKEEPKVVILDEGLDF